MLLTLKIAQGPDQGKDFALAEGSDLKIGRGEKSDLRLNDPSISRVHCEISCQNSMIMLRDLGSTSGTKLNGLPVDLTQVNVGDKIQIGDTVLVIVDRSSQDTTFVADHPPSADKMLDDLVGTKINSYLLEKIIGHGNTGVVFKALDEEKKRTAALKILSPQHSRLPQQRERFIRAMKTMIPIHSANIVRIYNAGISGPHCWTAMEYVEGENLAQLINRLGIEGMIDWKRVWKVIVDIAHALDTAHQHKIVHRNVTPTNILRRSSNDQCLLGDLMLAKALEGELAFNVTQPGNLMGEIQYLAPERTIPNADIDIRSDIYGLGATCYALLTGRPPAEGKNLAELLTNIRQVMPKEPRQFQLGVNELFQDQIIMRMLAKDPANRPQTPQELLDEMRRLSKFNGMPV